MRICWKETTNLCSRHAWFRIDPYGPEAGQYHVAAFHESSEWHAPDGTCIEGECLYPWVSQVDPYESSPRQLISWSWIWRQSCLQKPWVTPWWARICIDRPKSLSVSLFAFEVARYAETKKHYHGTAKWTYLRADAYWQNCGWEGHYFLLVCPRQSGWCYSSAS